MSRYVGYEGRNIYTEEFWYPALTVPEKLVIDTLLAASAILVPYVPTLILDPLLALAGWDEDSYRGILWRSFVGLKKADVVIDGTTVPVYEWSLRWAANLIIYQADPRSNIFYHVVGLYPNSPIPLNWRSNVWMSGI